MAISRGIRTDTAEASASGPDRPGSLAGAAGHDITHIALTDTPRSIGRAGGPPQIPLNLADARVACVLTPTDAPSHPRGAPASRLRQEGARP